MSVEQRIGEDWTVVMEWPDGVENGGPARLVIEPVGKMPAGGLSSTVLRQIDFRDAIARLRGQIGSNRPPVDYAPMREFERAQLRATLGSNGAASDEYLALLSWEYLRRVNAGQDKPVDRIAEELGRSLATVKGHLWQARKRGILIGGSAGRKGGELSPEAEELVEPYAVAWLDELDKLTSNTREAKTIEVETPAPKRNRRRSPKAISSRSKT